jgi:RHH-type proline utilization regulon transcriptional repressor/proline dehydrogenase/delta 1-pyrroline-5-carboxylate dehydrogenase
MRERPPEAPGVALVPDPEEVRRLGHALATRMRRRRGLRATLDDLLMARVAEDDQLRAALFRFVDVRPACRGLDDLGRHLAGFLGEVDHRPAPVALGDRLARRRRTRAAVGGAAALAVRRMARRFIVAEDEPSAAPVLRRLWTGNVAASIDLLGEATVTEAEADRYAQRCADMLIALSDRSRAWPERPVLESDAAGPLPRVNLSVKVSALTPHLRSDAPDRGIAGASARLRELLRIARDAEAHLHVDMESLDHRDAVLSATLDMLAEEEFRSGPSAGIVHQAYLQDSGERFDEILRWARDTPRAVPLTVRLVKGAYWDHELVQARQHGWTVPVYQDRAACDRNFEALTARLIEAFPVVRPAIASHNLRSVAHAVACQRRAGLAAADVEYQILRGLGDDLQEALAAEGLRVRAYCPVGDLVAGMAYLVRRLLENTSNDSFLRARATGVDLDSLLEAP